MLPKIARCPNPECGGHKCEIVFSSTPYEYCVCCDDCNMVGPVIPAKFPGDLESKKKAIELWNRISQAVWDGRRVVE